MKSVGLIIFLKNLTIESHIAISALFLKENTTEVNNMSRELKAIMDKLLEAMIISSD